MNNHQDEEMEFWPIIFIATIGIAVGIIQIKPEISAIIVLLSLCFLNHHLLKKKTKIEQELIAEDQSINNAFRLMAIVFFSFGLLSYLPTEIIKVVAIVMTIATIIFWLLALSGEKRNKIRIKKIENNIKEALLITGILWFVPLDLILAILGVGIFSSFIVATILVYKFEA